MQSLPLELIIDEIGTHLPIVDRCLLLFIMKNPNKYGRITFSDTKIYTDIAPRERLSLYKRIGRDSSFLQILNYLCTNRNFDHNDWEECLTANDVDKGQFKVHKIAADGIVSCENKSLPKYAICGGASGIISKYHHVFYTNMGTIRKYYNAWISVGRIDLDMNFKSMLNQGKDTMSIHIICIDYDRYEIFEGVYKHYYKMFGRKMYRSYELDHLSDESNLKDKPSNNLIRWIKILIDYELISVDQLYKYIFLYGKYELVPMLCALPDPIPKAFQIRLLGYKITKEERTMVDRLIERLMRMGSWMEPILMEMAEYTINLLKNLLMDSRIE